jgi:hypothetical protein
MLILEAGLVLVLGLPLPLNKFFLCNADLLLTKLFLPSQGLLKGVLDLPYVLQLG